ncbi:MAG: GNAT family N-acetyltransferase [Candidatus Methylomirabilales bacterium]
MRRIERIGDFRELDGCRESWNALVQTGWTNTIFQTYEWNRCWWEVFGGSNELLILVAKEDNTVEAVAPMMVVRRRARTRERRVVTFLGGGASDYCDFIVRKGNDDTMAEMLGYLLDQDDCWDRIALRNIPDWSRLNDVIPKVCEGRHFNALVDHESECPTLMIEGHLDYAREIANKKKLRQQTNYVKKLGQYEVCHFREVDNIGKYLEVFFDQHIERWNGSSTPSLFVEERNKAFYRRLTECLCERRWLLFTMIKLDGIPIACHYGFDYNNGMLFYKPSYNKRLARHSPGMVLLKELLDYAVTSKKSEFDFSLGSEPYKMRFSNKVRKNRSFCIFRSKCDYAVIRCRQLWRQMVKRGVARLARS